MDLEHTDNKLDGDKGRKEGQRPHSIEDEKKERSEGEGQDGSEDEEQDESEDNPT